jgi:putative Holliday junction resolvase
VKAGTKERAMGVDVGDRRIGIAVEDELGLMAHAREPIDARDRKRAIAELLERARGEEVNAFVVGLPLDMRGHEGDASKKARAFAQALADATEHPVQLFDERLTTVEAHRRLREAGKKQKDTRGLVDGVAASTLLQAWLDGRRGPRGL